MARRAARGRASPWQCLQCSGAARSARGAEAARCGCQPATRPAAVLAYFPAAATCCWEAGRGPPPEAGDLGSAPPAGVSYCPGGTRGHGACEDCSGGRGGGAAERPEPAVEVGGRNGGRALVRSHISARGHPRTRLLGSVFSRRASSYLGLHIPPPLVPHALALHNYVMAPESCLEVPWAGVIPRGFRETTPTFTRTHRQICTRFLLSTKGNSTSDSPIRF